MRPQFAKTIALDLSNFPASVSAADIASAIVSRFATFKVNAVQLLGKLAKVTFDNTADKESVMRFESIHVGEVECPVRGGGARPQKVIIFGFPFEGSTESLRVALSRYGEAHDIRFRHWMHMSSVVDGVRTVTMVRTGPIPRNIDVDGFHCKVSYLGQAIECDIYEKVGNVARVYPLRGCCFRCHQHGHLVRDCTNDPVAETPPGSSAVSSGLSAVDPSADLFSQDSAASEGELSQSILPQPSLPVTDVSECTAVDNSDLSSNSQGSAVPGGPFVRSSMDSMNEISSNSGVNALDASDNNSVCNVRQVINNSIGNVSDNSSVVNVQHVGNNSNGNVSDNSSVVNVQRVSNNSTGNVSDNSSVVNVQQVGNVGNNSNVVKVQQISGNNIGDNSMEFGDRASVPVGVSGSSSPPTLDEVVEIEERATAPPSRPDRASVPVGVSGGSSPPTWDEVVEMEEKATALPPSPRLSLASSDLLSSVRERAHPFSSRASRIAKRLKDRGRVPSTNRD